MTDKEIKKSITEKALNYGVPSKYSQLFDELSASFKSEFEKPITIQEIWDTQMDYKQI